MAIKDFKYKYTNQNPCTYKMAIERFNRKKHFNKQ